MTVDGVSKVSFGRLIIGNTVKARLAKKKVWGLKYYKQELARAKKIIIANGLHKQEHVDIILDERNSWDYRSGRFYCTISSKKQGVPMNPEAECLIGKDKESIDRFIQWVKEWNYMYSPKGLEDRRNIIERALDIMRKSGKKFFSKN